MFHNQIAKACTWLHLNELPSEVVRLSLVNGLSAMALNAASVFGILAILSGETFLHGLTGVGVYIVVSAALTFVGYVGVCRSASRFGLRSSIILYAVFVVHSLGFLGAAFLHPVCSAVSAGLGLGMFYAVFMLTSLTSMPNKLRDAYATFNGVVMQLAMLAAPLIGAGLLALAIAFGLANAFAPTFLGFSFSVLLALPLIRRMEVKPLPYSANQSLRKVFNRQYLLPSALYFCASFCECLMYPLLLVSSFALLNYALDVGWFSVFIAVMASLSLVLSRRFRLSGRRWKVFGGGLVGLGVAYLVFLVSFRSEALVVLGVSYALLRANYTAAWYALSSRLVEREFEAFGHNQALVVTETVISFARLSAAGVLALAGYAGGELRESLFWVIVAYLVCAMASMVMARSLENRDLGRVE